MSSSVSLQSHFWSFIEILLLSRFRPELNQEDLDYIHFNISGDPCILISSYWCDLFTNRTTFCSKSHLSLNERGSFTKIQQLIRSRGLFKETKQIATNWKTAFATFYEPAHYWISTIFLRTKILYLTNWILRFQNGCNKVVIELCVGEFCSEIIQVI